MSKTFYVTTTLPYVNAPLHMGHALEFVRADTYARYKELLGFDVYFNTGADEHGLKIYEKAIEKGLTPQQFVDQNFETFKEQLKIFNVSPNAHFIRTTDSHHEKAAQEFWKLVDKNGYIYKAKYTAKYCVGCEAEKTDSDLTEDGFCPFHPGIELQLIDEENYFFKYSAFEDKLLEFYEKNPNFIIPEFRFNEIKTFVKNGLKDFSISRQKEKMPWGISVPGDEEHVMYVWFDALTNYINTLGWPENTENFEKYWVNGTPTQYCGKDNTRFQGAMWQAMLMAANLPNSSHVVINGFITGDGGIRMSKTLGNAVDPREVVEEYGTDALRLFLLKEVSSFEDSPFTMDRFKDAYNANLANGLGNLTSRILTLSEKYVSDLVLDQNISLPEEYTNHFNSFDLKKAADYVWEEIGSMDKFIQETEPFKVIKVDEAKGKELISSLMNRLNAVSKMIAPMLPLTAQKLNELLIANKKPENPLFLRKE